MLAITHTGITSTLALTHFHKSYIHATPKVNTHILYWRRLSLKYMEGLTTGLLLIFFHLRVWFGYPRGKAGEVVRLSICLLVKL